MKQRRTLLRGCLALAFATAVWLPCVHLLFARVTTKTTATTISPQTRALAARHLDLWTDSGLKEHELARMRRSNAEWDFMGRSFLVWSLAEMSLREPARKAEYLPVMDRIIDETLMLEREQGLYFFLMPYAKARPFERQPPRSQFLDGEIAMMLAARRLVAEKIEYQQPFKDRVTTMVARMKQSPSLSAESYPNECWTFCNAIGLAAIKASDRLEGTDHSAFLRDWLAAAKRKLVHRETGLLISSYQLDGTPLDGPEGSSIWLVAHCLRLLDEDFARDQYLRARKELGRDMCGFAWSREWPVSWKGPLDIDSGMVIPLLDVSAGGSGLAFVGASSFEDQDYLTKLQTTLDFAAFPLRQESRLKYCASNQVGDAVLLYAGVLGPLWEKIKAGGK
jgi:Linalool dehydratase/isomerase